MHSQRAQKTNIEGQECQGLQDILSREPWRVAYKKWGKLEFDGEQHFKPNLEKFSP